MKQFKFKTFGVVALLAITACTSESNFNQVVEEQQTPQTQLKVQSQESALEALKGEIIITREEHFPTQIGRERDWFKKFFSRVLNVSEGEDWTRYTEEILDVIQKSKVDNSMKANLRGAIIIALASSKLWNSKTLRK